MFSAGKARYYGELQRTYRSSDGITSGTTDNQTILEKLYHGSYQNNVGVGSNRVLNLMYSSEGDLQDETSPLLEENVS